MALHAPTPTEQLEARLRQKATELDASNRELEAFAYSVSHDLRAPLRAISGFSQALLDEHSDKLDEQARFYLERVRAAGDRMAVMLDELLALSRLNRAELQRQELDLSALAHEIADNLRRSEPGRDVAFVIQDDIRVRADPALLRAVLENLIGNAWKFTAQHPQARIEVAANEHDREIVYLVRDDGAGFDTQSATKLFAPFQRMHTDEEFPGTGLGLAATQRIIRRHGGQIWADAEVDKGATFYFTL